MTTIDKLLIQGIRSFSPQNRNIIEFYKPLTLIVGHNGAGKTTIIECLKYATTGNMPPGAKNGQAFIHDPKVAGEREVKAQIKLRFRNVNGKPIVCTRSLQLTQQANDKKVCKTLESALQTYNAAGEKVSQSFRCADLDREIPELVGVSRPILENVIFCHQEESNWPLSETSVLKKKFDEIFAATRYTKALEAIKKHRKEQAQQIKECKLRLENLQNQKDHAHQIQRELKSKLEFQAKANEEMAALQREIDEQEKLLTELKRKFNSINTLMTEIKQLKAVRQQMVNENQKTYAELKQEFEESDEELLSLAASFNEEMESRRQAENALEGKLEKLHRSKNQHDAALFSINEQMSSIKSAIERRKTILAERDSLILEFIDYYGLQDFDKPPYSEAKMTKFLETTKKLLNAIMQKTMKLKEENVASAKNFSDVLNRLQSEQSTLEAQMTQKRSQLRANENKLKQLESEIKAKRALHSSLGALEAQMQSEQEALEQAKKEAGLEELAREIGDLMQQRKQVETGMNSLRELMRKLNLQADARAKLNVKKSQQREREETYRARYQSKQADFEAVLGQAVNIEALKPALGKSIAAKREEVAATRSRLEGVKMKASSLVGEEKSIKSRLAQLERQLQAKREEIKVIGEDDRPLPVLIKEAEKKVENVRKDVLMIQSAELIYQNFIELARENQECPLCDRGIHGDALKKMLDQMQSTIDNVPTSLQENKQLLTEQETLYEQLCGLLPTWQDITRLKDTEVPQIQQRLSAIQQSMTELNSEIKESTLRLEKLQAEEAKASALMSDAEAILRHYKDFTVLSEQIRAEESTLLQSSSDMRTVEEVDKEYSTLKEKSQELLEASERAQKEQQARQDNIRRLESCVFELKDKLLQSKGSYDSIALLQRNMAEIENSSKTLQQEIRGAEEGLAVKLGEREEVLAQKNQTEAENEAKMNEVVNERQLFQERLAFIETLQKQISGKNLEELMTDEEKLAKKKQETEARIVAINEDVKKGNDTLLEIRESLATSDIFKRNIDDNIRYRKQKADLEKLNTRVKKKEEEAQLENTESVEFDMDRLTSTTEQKKRKLNQLIGKRDTFTSQIKEHHKELAKPIYKDIDDQFRQMLIKVKTTEMATSDLEKYYHALNKALMKYHQVKMEEINKILRELWQHTYKGQDIDTIEIRADVDPTKEGGKSSYNYRVIMVKGDTELDMRGRCSAGQKVLASLVIRLALAETFCLNCGILALDEPTTNLDRYNVESFANALVNIIASRSQQRNFQLIIITHDEEFVQLLGRSEHADYYWRVSKDINGHSILERQDIRDLS